MKTYDVYVGYGSRPAAADKRIHLENFALGLGVPGITTFQATGGSLPPVGDPEFEPVFVFRFILPETHDLSWSIQAFAAEAKRVLEQRTVLVTVTDVLTYQV